MKTLDEVIEDFEKACDLKRRCEGCSGCLGQENGCPNDGAESVPDALYYLKEYQTLQYGYIKAMADLEDNPPLTWSELKLMEGKPVWLESKRYGDHWYLLEYVYHDSLDCIGIYEERVSYDRNDDDWKSYRKERE